MTINEPGSHFRSLLADALDQLVAPPASVLLAVSGGCDSVALLRGWVELAGTRGDRLAVAHFDHRLRPDSGRDAEFVAALAARLGVQFHMARADATGRRCEDSARRRRYTFLADVARKAGCEHVAVAHTADDQVETVLHAILRGTGLAGLAGMPAVRSLTSHARLIRPMLTIPRRCAKEFLDARGQPYCTDESNSDTTYTRNRIRHELLPLLRDKFNPGVAAALTRLAEIARLAIVHLDHDAAQLLQTAIIESSPSAVTLRCEPLASVDTLLACQAVRLLFARQGWPRRRLGMTELRRIIALANGETPSAWDLPDGVRVSRSDASPSTLRVITT
jgi:tRNA(Ile)-lysidine synthase